MNLAFDFDNPTHETGAYTEPDVTTDSYQCAGTTTRQRKGRTKEEMQAIDKDVKPELRIGSRTCQCDCGLFFTAVGPFDLHRVFDDPKVHDWETRRCLTPEEMAQFGMVANKYGVWSTGTYKREDPED